MISAVRLPLLFCLFYRCEEMAQSLKHSALIMGFGASLFAAFVFGFVWLVVALIKWDFAFSRLQIRAFVAFVVLAGIGAYVSLRPEAEKKD